MSNKDALAEIVALAKLQLTYERRVMEAEQALKDANAQLRSIQDEALPLAMKEAKLKKFTLDSGETIDIKDDFAVGIPAERRPEAFAWLEKEGYAGLIKTEVAVAFGKGDLAKAEKLVTDLLKKNLPAQLSREVNWQTLKAWVNEMTRNTKPIPMDLFGATPTVKSIIKAPKPKG